MELVIITVFRDAGIVGGAAYPALVLVALASTALTMKLAQLCIRVPGPGAYSVSLLHDRDGNRKFGLSQDGIGFPGDPKIGLSKPKAAKARVVAGPGLTTVAVRLNYRRGLFRFGPIKER